MEMDDSLAPILQRLEDELFFAVLDVALDIEAELVISDSQPLYIPVRRLAIRYRILYPVHSAGTTDRYCQLRWKAGLFLKKYSFIRDIKFREQGIIRWDGLLEITVPHQKRFSTLLAELRLEENRRNPERKMEADFHSATARLIELANSFHRVALRLRTRHADRPPFLINDEYDVQDLFAALLETRFEDVRREEWGPSYAGGATRVDFFLKNESVLLETKMTREGLTDRKLGEELIVDIAHYKQRSNCKALACFVYDPEHRLKNPNGLENDLSRRDEHLEVRVLIRPKS
jgi:hypothetical protein